MTPRHSNPIDPVNRLAKRLHFVDDRYHDWDALSADAQDRYLNMAESAIVWSKNEADTEGGA